jgi:hypothetical protein
MPDIITAKEWRKLAQEKGTWNLAKSIDVGVRVLKDYIEDEYASLDEGSRSEMKLFLVELARDVLGIGRNLEVSDLEGIAKK